MTEMQAQQVQQTNTEMQQQSPLQPQGLRPGGGGGGEGGRRDGGGSLPPLPDGDDLFEFLEFVHRLLGYWERRIESDADEFNDIAELDRIQLRTGWAEFQNQWALTIGGLREQVRSLDAEDLRRRGLVGSAYRMKRHFIKKWRDRLAEAYEAGRAQFQIRRLWHKMFAATDVVLDSVERSLSFVPGSGAIVSGLKEFKETAMGVTEGDATD